MVIPPLTDPYNGYINPYIVVKYSIHVFSRRFHHIRWNSPLQSVSPFLKKKPETFRTKIDHKNEGVAKISRSLSTSAGCVSVFRILGPNCHSHFNVEGVTLPETNIFAPKNGCLEYDPFLLGFGLFSGATSMLVSGRGITWRLWLKMTNLDYLERWELPSAISPGGRRRNHLGIHEWYEGEIPRSVKIRLLISFFKNS